MSDSEEPEYEVESVVAAKVEAASRSKNPKLVWKYLVRWKGYTSEDDTWEPIDSFSESKHILEAFWKRASTGGRDVEDMSLFEAGEQFLPIGPPRHKRKSTGGPTSTPSAMKVDEEESASKAPSISPGRGSTKRERSPGVAETSDRPAKRTRGQVSRVPQPVASSSSSPSKYGTRSKDNATSISASTAPKGRAVPARVSANTEVVPDSDEDNAEMSAPKTPARTMTTRKASQKERSPPIVIEDDTPSPKVSKPVIKPTTVDGPVRKIPAHRARLNDPRVKLVDNSHTLDIEGSISAKARAVKNVSTKQTSAPEASSSRSRRKPGPGRDSTDSLLTGVKGGLKTIKGKPAPRKSARSAAKAPAAVAMDVDPPTPQELMRLAGAEQGNDVSLSDPDDDGGNADAAAVKDILAENASVSSAEEIEKATAEARRQENLTIAKNNLFPQAASPPTPKNMNWGRSTIFDSISTGSTSQNLESSTNHAVYLTLDSSVIVPILVTDASASQLYLTRKMGSQQVPGKFYESDSAISLLTAVRAIGQSTVINLADNASVGEKAHFDIFQRRLEDGDIFVAVTGLHIVVFSCSNNTLLSSRINAPANILNDPTKVLMTQVEVENYSGYADAAAKADPRRWTEYISAQ